MKKNEEYMLEHAGLCRAADRLEPQMFDEYGVKRGLRDKNGKLIWENDIMQAHLDDSFPEDATYTRVVWDNNGFCTEEQGSEDISPLDKFDQEHFEVCGNIFDNPELLEVGE